MALGTGLREHELIALSVGDVFRDGRPRRRLLLSVFKGASKAGGTQEVLLSESLRGKLRRFWAWKAREHPASGNASTTQPRSSSAASGGACRCVRSATASPCGRTGPDSSAGCRFIR